MALYCVAVGARAIVKFNYKDHVGELAILNHGNVFVAQMQLTVSRIRVLDVIPGVNNGVASFAVGQNRVIGGTRSDTSIPITI